MAEAQLPLISSTGVIREGAELRSTQDNARYCLLTRLGGGKYSEVWKARLLGEQEQDVAVKIVAPDLDADERRVIFEEPFFLKRLTDKLGETNAADLVPQIISIADQSEPAFFAMSLASGTALDEVMRKESLSEVEVLTLGEQLCRVFDGLHALEHSYLDFQPRNIFWDATAARITVIDWNLLSPKGQVDVAADLEHIAQLLYRLLVGQRFVPERWDEPPAWTNLTSGTRHFLVRALVQKAYPTARLMGEKQQALIQWWKMEIEELVRKSQELSQNVSNLAQNQASADPSEHEDGLRNVLAALDIARYRQGKETAAMVQLREQVRQKLRGSGLLGAGQAEYLMGNVPQAIALFTQARQEGITRGERLTAQRWLAVLDDPSGSREATVQWMRTLAQWTEAWLEGKKQGNAAPDPAGLPAVMEAERQGWQALRNAALSSPECAEEHRQSARDYRQALQWAQGLPYQELLRSIWGKLEVWAEEHERQGGRMDAEVQREEELEALFQRRSQDAVDRLVQLLQKAAGAGSQDQGLSAPGTPSHWIGGDERLTQLALDWAGRLCGQKEYDRAKSLLGRIVIYAAPRRLDDILSLRRNIDAACQADLQERRQQVQQQQAALRPLHDWIAGEMDPREVVTANWEEIHRILRDVVKEKPRDEGRRRMVWEIASRIYWYAQDLPPTISKELLKIAREVAPGKKNFNRLQDAKEQAEDARQKDLKRHKEMARLLAEAQQEVERTKKALYEEMGRRKEVEQQLKEARQKASRAEKELQEAVEQHKQAERAVESADRKPEGLPQGKQDEPTRQARRTGTAPAILMAEKPTAQSEEPAETTLTVPERAAVLPPETGLAAEGQRVALPDKPSPTPSTPPVEAAPQEKGAAVQEPLPAGPPPQVEAKEELPPKSPPRHDITSSPTRGSRIQDSSTVSDPEASVRRLSSAPRPRERDIRNSFICTQIIAAKTAAKQGHQQGYQQALDALAAASSAAQKQGDADQMAELDALADEYSAALRNLRKESYRSQVEQHRKNAQMVLEQGVIIGFDEASRLIGQAIGVARMAGDRGLEKELEAEQERYKRFRDRTKRQWIGVKTHEEKGEYQSALELLEQMSHSGIAGNHQPGELDEWRNRLQQRAWAVQRFEQTEAQWNETADPRQREALLQEMGRACQELYNLVDLADKPGQEVVSRLKKRYVQLKGKLPTLPAGER